MEGSADYEKLESWARNRIEERDAEIRRLRILLFRVGRKIAEDSLGDEDFNSLHNEISTELARE